MGRTKGTPKTGGQGFKKGHDPRRNMNGGPKADVRVREIKSEIKVALIEVMKEYFHLPANEAEALGKDKTLSLGKRTALRFWVEAANKGDPVRMSFIARIIGLEAPQKIEVDPPDHANDRSIIDALSEQLAIVRGLANDDPGLK